MTGRPDPFDTHVDPFEIRVRRPEAIAEAARRRTRRESLVGADGRLLIVAADHPARGVLRVGERAMAMADRAELLRRVRTALSRPGVDGVLGTADVLEELLLRGALDGKVVVGSMNRGGLAGTVFELDDRFTGYGARSLAAAGFDGGKMLLRIDPADPASASTLAACAAAVDQLADHRLLAMVEPFFCRRVNAGDSADAPPAAAAGGVAAPVAGRRPVTPPADGRVRNDLSTEAVIRALTVASGLGSMSAYTWLKVPVAEDMERVAAATSLPLLLLGGDVTADPEAAYARWEKALRLPTVRGLVVGRTLLYPPDDDVAGAVDTAVRLLGRHT